MLDQLQHQALSVSNGRSALTRTHGMACIMAGVGLILLGWVFFPASGPHHPAYDRHVVWLGGLRINLDLVIAAGLIGYGVYVVATAQKD